VQELGGLARREQDSESRLTRTLGRGYPSRCRGFLTLRVQQEIPGEGGFSSSSSGPQTALSRTSGGVRSRLSLRTWPPKRGVWPRCRHWPSRPLGGLLEQELARPCATRAASLFSRKTIRRRRVPYADALRIPIASPRNRPQLTPDACTRTAVVPSSCRGPAPSGPHQPRPAARRRSTSHHDPAGAVGVEQQGRRLFSVKTIHPRQGA
jgi:hypothetical protein